MRLIFIPGFGEDPSIFENLAPRLPGNKVFVDHWERLPREVSAGLSADSYAGQIAADFQITPRDILIGHSMGGWIAHHIKIQVGCPIVQIASWTDQSKVAGLPPVHSLMYWAVGKGLCFNRWVKWLLLIRRNPHDAETGILRLVLDRLCTADTNQVNNELRIIFTAGPEGFRVGPDLRIHARADRIVRFPDEPCEVVPGGHFSLWTHPEEVAGILLAFLQQLEDRTRASCV